MTCRNLFFWFNRLTGMIFLMEFISVFSFLEYNLQKMNYLFIGEYFDDDGDDTIRYIEEQRWNNSIEGD